MSGGEGGAEPDRMRSSASIWLVFVAMFICACMSFTVAEYSRAHKSPGLKALGGILAFTTVLLLFTWLHLLGL